MSYFGSMIPTVHEYSHSQLRQFSLWQSEYMRLLDEEAKLRRQLYSLDCTMEAVARKLERIQSRLIELQMMMNQNS